VSPSPRAPGMGKSLGTISLPLDLGPFPLSVGDGSSLMELPLVASGGRRDEPARGRGSQHPTPGQARPRGAGVFKSEPCHHLT
jgi:hypothetical protein